jgi:hypothetical protein
MTARHILETTLTKEEFDSIHHGIYLPMQECISIEVALLRNVQAKYIKADTREQQEKIKGDLLKKYTRAEVVSYGKGKAK